MCAAFELSECAWSLAARNEEKKNDKTSFGQPSSSVVLSKLAITIQLCYVSYTGKFIAVPNAREVKNELI